MTLVAVAHDTIMLDGMEIFFRQASPADAPLMSLPHGYPCPSFEFRNCMAALGDRSARRSPSEAAPKPEGCV
jgi:hypothetical protein